MSDVAYYCLTTRAGRERELISAICREALEPICPLTYRRRQGQRKETVWEVPLIPRYVVVGAPALSALAPLFAAETVKGRLVTGALRCDGELYRVPPSDVERLRALHHWQPVVPALRGLRVGDTVRIADGPFAGYLVRVTRARDLLGRVRVAQRIFGAVREIMYDESLLAPVA